MKEIVFRVTPEDDGDYCAAWDAPGSSRISMQGDDLAKLEAMIKDTALCHFDDDEIPEHIRLHFVRDRALALA